MSVLKVLYSTVVDALFPISKAEQEVLAVDRDRALGILPRAEKSPIEEAYGIFSYRDERVWRLIWCIKYKKSLPAARIAGSVIFQILSTYSPAASPIIVVPMPITARRRRERGFNQCELIVDEIERSDIKTQTGIGADVCSTGHGGILVVRDLLIRIHHRSRQTLKDRSHRLESAQGIFAVDEKAASDLDKLFGIRCPPRGHDDRPDDRSSQRDAEGERDGVGNYLILVIDDVITTGSTIRDAIYTLRKAGFEKSFGLSVAH